MGVEVGEGRGIEHEDEENEPRISFALATHMIANLQKFWLNMSGDDNDHHSLLRQMRKKKPNFMFNETLMSFFSKT